MWEDSLGPALAWESAPPTVALTAIRAVAGPLIGFAITLACGMVGVIASLGSERRGWRPTSA